MARLDEAVRQGIITPAQRAAIEALESAPRGLSVTLVNVFWVAGYGLVLSALVVLAMEIADGSPQTYVVLALIYAAVMALVDRLVSRDPALRLLSSLCFLSFGFCLTAAIIAWQFTIGMPMYLQDWSTVPIWSQVETRAEGHWRYHPVIHGPWLPAVPILATAFALIKRRAFLPTWTPLLLTAGFLIFEVVLGLGFAGQLKVLQIVFLVIGVSAAGAGWYCDRFCLDNHGFWIAKFSLIAFTGFILTDVIDQRTAMVVTVSLCLILFALYIRRSAGFAVAAIGITWTIGQWLNIWDNWLLVSAILAVTGLAAIVAGVHLKTIEAKIDSLLPPGLKYLRPKARHDPVTFGIAGM